MLSKEKEFYFETKDAAGQLRHGTVKAKSRKEVEQRLLEQGFKDSNVYEVASRISSSHSDNIISKQIRQLRVGAIIILIIIISAIIYFAISR